MCGGYGGWSCRASQREKAPFEDIDPGCWRGSCSLVVEDFQDANLCTCNLLNCPRCVQRWCVVGLVPGEESCDCVLQIGKWASVSLPEIRFDKSVDCVVSPFRPHMGEVQDLKREICTVARKKSGGNEVLQEVNALLSVEPLSV